MKIVNQESNQLKSYISNRVTVIIPTFNYSDYLSCAIESVLMQKIADLEVIVVDDGSTDSTEKKLRMFEKKIRYIYQRNQGLSSARNKGLDYATGEYILFLDADDMLGKDTIEVQQNFLRAHPDIPISVCKNKLFDSVGTQGYPNLTGEWQLYHQALDVHLCYSNIAPPHAYLTRKEAINTIGRFDTKLKACEDWDFWLRAASLGFIPYYNPEGIVYYRKHPLSMSANLKNQRFYDVLLHQRLSKLLQEHPRFPIGYRLEGILAFTAGTLNTVKGLQDQNLDCSADLLKLVLERLQNAQNTVKKPYIEWSNLSTLFYLRILSLLKEINIVKLSVKEEILSMIQIITASALKSRSKLKLFTTMVRNCLQDKRKFCLENKEIKYHLKKFFFRPILLQSYFWV